MDLSRLKRQIAIGSGLNAARRHARPKPRVLYWHSIARHADPVLCPEVFELDLFKKQINYLRRHFEIVSIDVFNERLENDRFSGKEMLLTFDDGYATNLHEVAPVLTALHLPFTVFISTDNISTGEFFPTAVNRLVTVASDLETMTIPTLGATFTLSTRDEKIAASKLISREMKRRPLDEVRAIVEELKGLLPAGQWEQLKGRFDCLRPMNWDEVRQLSQSGLVTIGSHCKWHLCCHERQPQEVIGEQIVSSKRIIEEQLQQPCDYFAYPNGDYTDYSDTCVKSAYKLGFTAETRTVVSPGSRSVLPRIVGYTPDMSLFKIIVSA